MSAEVGGGNAAKSEPNVVPLCDILLVLLIIFMVVTPMIQKGVSIKLPEAEFTDDQPKTEDMITVYLKKDGSIYLSGQNSTTLIEDMSKLAQAVQDKMEEKNQEDKTKILLRADVEVEYGKVVDLMDHIKDAEIEVIGLISDKVSK